MKYVILLNLCSFVLIGSPYAIAESNSSYSQNTDLLPSYYVAQATTNNCQERDEFETPEQYQERCKEFLNQPISSRNDTITIFDLKKDAFEDEQAYKQRIARFNEEVMNHNPEYQAGVAYLLKEKTESNPGYDIKTGKFPLRIEWKEETEQFFIIDKGTIHAPVDEATTLWKENQQHPFPVFVTIELFEGEAVAKDVSLVSMGKTWEVSLQGELFDFKCHEFETPTQCQARLKNAVERYNKAVEQFDPQYQAGIAFLDNFDQGGETYNIKITWQKWAEQQFDLVSQNTLHITREEAIQLKREGSEKPVFVSVEASGTQIKIATPFLVGSEKMWAFQSLKTVTEDTKEICIKNCEDVYDRCVSEKRVCKRVACDLSKVAIGQMYITNDGKACQQCQVSAEASDYCHKTANCQKCYDEK